MADVQVHPFGTVAVPGDWIIPPSLTVALKACYAHFDGSNAAGPFVPELQLISDAGTTVLKIPQDSPIAAGSSVDASWAPFLRGKALAGVAVHGPFQVTVAQNVALAATGIPIYAPSVDDVLLDAWIEVTTAWNGTTPQADIGQYLAGNSLGWFGFVDGPRIVDLADQPALPGDTYLTGVVAGQFGGSLEMAATIGRQRIVPGRFTGTDPIFVVVSQDGFLGSLPVGGTTGILNVYLVVGTPETP